MSFWPAAPGERGRLDAEGLRARRGEDPGPAELHPASVEPDLGLQARLRVREERGPYPDLLEAHPCVELPDQADKHAQAGALLHDDALDLLEHGKVRRVDRLAAEHLPHYEGLLRRFRMGREVPDRVAGGVGD